jgi:PilZ domain.
MILEVPIGPLGWAVIVCPECKTKSHTRPKKELHNKILDRICICGLEYKLIFDTRSARRKKCSSPGILFAEKDIPVVIKDISTMGASFESDVTELEVRSFYRLKIKISKNWIEVLARIARVDRKIAGVSFVSLDTDQKKVIESYILS